MTKTVSRSRQILTVIVVALAIKVLLGDAIAGFMSGMYLGFTDGI
jgi:hypothetical protein